MTRVCEPWTGREDQRVRQLYPNYASLQKLLPHRTLGAIKQRAGALKVARRRHVWTQLEVAKLKRMFATGRPSDEQLQAAFPSLRIRQITGQLRFLHLRRDRLAPVILGVPVLDAIRDKAFREGITLTDLDRFAETKRYFQSSVRRICWRHVCAAVDFLGGELRPAWDDEQDDEGQALPVPFPRAA